MIAAANAAFDPDVEEALLRVYGIDPHRATLRRVDALVRRLPPGSWQRDQTAAAWTREAWLLADVVDAVNQVAWITAAANSKQPPQRPKPYPRPQAEVVATAQARSSWSQIFEGEVVS